ncbi:YhgE/Pip domain-containing protein [Paenibacillus chartarius]|uniref:YhgE/Pip domain-containing protein n=1 Tax=Paenibacillus chartarius TaxID=747481 RepID=A0ABV6DI57_9BACL
MGKTFQTVLKQPTTIVGIVIAIVFQLVFSIIWMTGYKGITDNTNKLVIAIVNEDSGLGKTLVEGLSSNLPFQVTKLEQLSDAQQKLDERKFHMVLHVSSDFSKQLQTPGQTAMIHYYINESNPQLIKSVMQSVSTNITAIANKQAIAAGAQAALQQVNPQLPADRAAPIASGLSERVVSDVQSSNKVTGMHNQMVPMMLVLASYVGAMIMAQNVQISMNIAGAQLGKWPVFGVRVVLNIGSAIVVSLVATAMVHALGGQSVVSFATMWGFLALVMVSFMFFAQMFLILFGNAGMILNIIMLSAQLVSSGAMVPRELLNGFYHGISTYLPATYAVEGNMDILFGGPSLGASAISLLLITVVCFGVCVLGVAVRRERRSEQGAGARTNVQPTA